ncbi:Inner membrane component of T3SS domain-containing protein [Nocardioides terrae]|uniref:Inner membrane component of T3SS domain-containing protein n=1 Tax=Nocardioides terrae TaxID=574651 RepID=A0A1I1JFA0_9ACTN|nr:FHA domain-containing protein [Nocardioides terrae]SFC44653.1 Inner membrane component of T3SS domain-containing protein [Nocardioides terrae]
MNQVAELVRAEVARLVHSHGPDLLDDARRVRAMLADAVPGSTGEANLLGLAISAGVPAKLRQRGVAAAPSIARELEESSSVQSQDAMWVVGTIAEAMRLRPEPVPDRTLDGLRTTGAPDVDDLTVRAAGREFVVRAATGATIGRDPECTITLDDPGVSRLHGRLEHAGGTWVYVDQQSTQGSFIDGVAVTRHEVDGQTEVRLGQGSGASRLTLLPATRRPPVNGHGTGPGPGLGNANGAAPQTVLPGQRPGGVLAVGAAPPTELGTGMLVPTDTATVTLDGVSRTVTPGSTLTIGREADCDLVATASTVSRHHARLEHVAGGWHLRDLGSTSGTWHQGARQEDMLLAGDQEVILGDPAKGQRVLLRTPGAAPAARPLRRAARKPRSHPSGVPTRALIGLGAAVLGLVLVAVAAVVVLSRDDKAPVATVTKDDLARATVALLATNGDEAWGGSGVIVDADKGLILTNAHVAAPAAVGRALRGADSGAPYLFADEATANPDDIEVSVNEGLDTSAEPRFTATLVAADGYLDLAVVRITKKFSGTAVAARDLAGLTEVRLGDSDTVRTGDPVTYVGYPGAADSADPTLTTGSVASTSSDDRLNGARALVNTTATASGGNSGGLAFDAHNRMVGVPTVGLLDKVTGAAVLSGFVPVNLALRLIKAARAGKDYVSPYATAAPDGATAEVTLAEPGRPGTAAVGCQPDSGTSPVYAWGVDLTGTAGGKHTDVVGELTDLGSGDSTYVATSYPTEVPADGCVTLSFGRLDVGRYELKVGLGGDLRVVNDTKFTLR